MQIDFKRVLLVFSFVILTSSLSHAEVVKPEPALPAPCGQVLLNKVEQVMKLSISKPARARTTCALPKTQTTRELLFKYLQLISRAEAATPARAE